MKNICKIAFLIATLANMNLVAKEPTNILIGFGIGAGQSKLSQEFSQLSRDPTTNLAGWTKQSDNYLDSWALAWEFMIGYKHFINDFVGFRYYGNVGIQHYAAKSRGENGQKIGFVDYTLNADLLIDFYETTGWAIGMVGGMGFGGTSFDKNAISQYLGVYSSSGNPIGLADVQKHFLNANASVGLRVAIFQKIRRIKDRVCDSYVNGKRVCRVPFYYIGHNIELNAKFSLLDYKATANPDIQVVNGTTTHRPGYTVNNPYRITIRYIVDF